MFRLAKIRDEPPSPHSFADLVSRDREEAGERVEV
jgi:hypothetical protein